MNIQQLDLNKFSALTNALGVAAERFRENAKAFRDAKPTLEQQESETPDALFLIHSNACDPLAEQFDAQAEEVLALREEFEEAYYADA